MELVENGDVSIHTHTIGNIIINSLSSWSHFTQSLVTLKLRAYNSES